MSTIRINIKRLNAAVKKYREQEGFNDGVIVTYQHKAQGWVNELRDPKSWMPGCIATDSDGKHYLAFGGNAYDGANEWRPLPGANA